MTGDRELLPEYLDKIQSAEYLHTTTKKIALFRKHGLLKYCKLGKEFIYKKSWLDEFAETWSGEDLSSPEKIIEAIDGRAWRARNL